MAKDIFINRKAELAKLINGLKRINDFILIAPRRFGKTSLAFKVLDEIKLDKNIIVINLDIMSYSGGSIKSIAEGIIEKCLNTLGIMGKFRLLLKQIDFSFNLKMRYHDLELEPIIQLFKDGDKEDEWKLLEEALQLPEKIAIREKKQVVMFFDEFGELSLMGERIIKLFRSVIQLHKHVSYLFAGSQETLMTKIFVDKSGAFYRFGELIYLHELTKEDVYTYIETAYPDIKLEVLLEVVNLTKCHPYYSARILEHFADDKTYYMDISHFYEYVNTVLIPQEHSYIELQLLKIKENIHALEVLRLIAMGLTPAHEFNLIARQNLYKILHKLEAAGHIRKIAKSNYVLNDPLIEYYLTKY